LNNVRRKAYANKHQRRVLLKSEMTEKILLRAKKASIDFRAERL
jgi:hypothetical protein